MNKGPSINIAAYKQCMLMSEHKNIHLFDFRSFFYMLSRAVGMSAAGVHIKSLLQPSLWVQNALVQIMVKQSFQTLCISQKTTEYRI